MDGWMDGEMDGESEMGEGKLDTERDVERKRERETDREIERDRAIREAETDQKNPRWLWLSRRRKSRSIPATRGRFSSSQLAPYNLPQRMSQDKW